MIFRSNLYNKHSFLEKWNFQFNRFREGRNNIYMILKPRKNPLKIHILTPKIVKKKQYTDITIYYYIISCFISMPPGSPNDIVYQSRL